MASYLGYDDSMRENWLAPPTPVMKRLLIINAVVFALEVLLVASSGYEVFRSTFARFFALSGDGQRSFMVWQFGTYMFLHDPYRILHILFNSLFLWMFGRDVEYDLGPRRFLCLYLASGIVGGLFWLPFNFSHTGYVLGASGAVWGVCIAFATLYPERPIRILFILVMKAKWWALFAVAIELYFCLMVTGPVANLAHMGGIVTGYLFIKWLGYGEMPGWMAAVQNALPAVRNRQPNPNDEYHSSRPGVAHNHPYRTLDEEEPKPTVTKKGVFGRVFSRVEKPVEQMDKDEYIRQEVDPILDKIAKHGMQSLTRRERQILEAAREKMDKRS